MILNFSEFLRESLVVKPKNTNEITPRLRDSLDKLDVFNTEEEIVAAIKATGFIAVSRKTKDRTCDYAFLDPVNGYEYRSTTKGYVRSFIDTKDWRSQEFLKSKTPITRALLPNAKDRLLLIYRRAVKIILGPLYKSYSNSPENIREFIEKHRGQINSRQFGI